MTTELLALILAQALDVSSTCVALGRPNTYEANPVLPRTCTSIALTKGAVTAGAVFTLSKVHTKHPRLVKVLAIGATAATGYAVYRNIQVAGK